MTHPSVTRLLRGEELDTSAAHALFAASVRGELSDIELTAALITLKVRGEAPDEIAGAATALREAALPFVRPDYAYADLVGTGGDSSGTFNVSTAAALVVAEAGLPIAKHGNRSVSSRCGSADLLERCGVRLDMSPTTARHCLDEVGVTFLFAPHYHPGIRHAMAVRKALATRTLFNLLGPLVNPARPPFALVGVYDARFCIAVAETLGRLGCERALVVHGGGLDEIATHDETIVAELRDGIVEVGTIEPSDFGAQEHPLASLAGGEPEHNERALRDVLGGAGSEAHATAVAMNAAALLTVAGLHATLPEGYERARAILHSGAAQLRLERLAKRSQAQD